MTLFFDQDFQIDKSITLFAPVTDIPPFYLH